MANTSRRNGFTPVKTIDGKAYNGQSETFYHAAGTTVTHDLFVGDMVTFSGTGDADGVPGVVVATAGTGNASIGVIVGIKHDPDNLGRGDWIDGASAGYVYVCTDPNVVYEVQCATAIAITDLGYGGNMVQTAAGSRTSGASGQELHGTVANNAADQLKIVGFPQRGDQTINAVFNRVLVIINNHLFKGGTGTAGI